MADSRLAFDIVARGGSGAAAEFEKVARATDHAGDAMKKTGKISDELAKKSDALAKARNSETDALDKVQVAESKLSDARQAAQAKTAQVKTAEKDLLTVRNNTRSTTSQIAAAEAKLQTARNSSNSSTSKVLAAEKSLAKARRDAAVAGNVAQKAAKELGQALDNEGKKAGQSAGKSVLHWFTGAGKDFEKAGKEAGKAGGDGILGALSGTLKTPVLGPIVAVALIGAVEAVAVPAGALLAGGVVAGFGAGIAGLGLKFAAEGDKVKAAWSALGADLLKRMQVIATPLQETLLSIAETAQRTFSKLAPELNGAFSEMAPVISRFADELGSAFARLGPAIQPLSHAFSAVLLSLGPALNDMLGKISGSLIDLANSVAKNPDALSDLVRGVGDLTSDLLSMIKVLNDANGAFKRLTGVSGVTALFGALRTAIGLTVGPIVALAGGVGAVADKLAGATPQVEDLGKAATLTGGAAADMAGEVAEMNAAHERAAAAAGKSAAALGRSAHETHAANVAAAILAGTYDRQAAATQKAIDALNRMSGVLLSLSGAQIAYQQAVDDATQAIKDNGKTHDINTQKGRDNKTALDQVAASAIAQRDAMLKANDGNVKAAASATASRATFVKLATSMGYTIPQAKAMAQSLIKIPNVTRTAKLTANKKDLETKLAQAEKALKSPHLTATKKAKLMAEIKNLQAGVAESKRLLAGLPSSKTAKAKADITDLQSKLATAKKKLADPHLTATKKAKLQAEIGQLQAAVRKAQQTINGLHGKTVTNSVVTRYSSTGVNLTAPSSVGRRAAGGPVRKGMPYVVGEHRPELFVPKQDGTIVPKVPRSAKGSAFAGSGGGMTININVNGARDPRATADEVVRSIRKYVKVNGGDVQAVFGS